MNIDAMFPAARPWVIAHLWKVVGIGAGGCLALGIFIGWGM